MADNVLAAGTARRERLARRRKSLGLTQEGLACLLGVERSTVMRWERGDTEPLPRIQPKLARALQVSAGQLGELLAIGGQDGQAGAEGARTTVPRQLPAAVADFTGRATELAVLTRILDDAGGAPGTVVISAIGGTAGVGKTALALYWAHRVAHRFGDGQLYVNLRGFGPSGTPVAPAEAIHAFLGALGVPPERIPAQSDAQAGLLRSLLADKRMLIVLDNARDEQQVRPLLPASPASLVLVTSRNQLTGLAAADAARLLDLDVLSHGEAVQLLTARIGSTRAGGESEAVREIVTLCACLPLALSVAAARAVARPGFSLATLAAELRDSAWRLDALDIGDPGSSVRAVISWSYQQLDAEAGRMFRLLGLHPGPDIGVPAAASLAGCEPPQAHRLLRELTRACLITENRPGRYAFHDLLRAYAANQAQVQHGAAEREAATRRVLDHYLHTATVAGHALKFSREQAASAPPEPGVVVEQIADRQQALAWFDTEMHVLLAAVALAAESGFDGRAWQLPQAIASFLAMRGHYREWAATQQTALAAAARLGNTAGQATSSRLLARAYARLGEFDRAVAHHGDALTHYRRLGDLDGEARTHAGLSWIAERQGRYADGLDHSERALRLFQPVGNNVGQADMLNNVGWSHAQLGDFERARAFCQRSLSLGTKIGDADVQTSAWDTLGNIEHHLGNLPQAAACYQRSATLARELGNRHEEASSLTHLGDVRHAEGQPRQARGAWRQALAILTGLDHPDARTVRAKLADADD